MCAFLSVDRLTAPSHPTYHKTHTLSSQTKTADQSKNSNLNTPLEAPKYAWEIETAIAAALEKGLRGGPSSAAATVAADASSGDADGGEGEGIKKGRVLYETQGLSGMLGTMAMHFRRRDPVLTCTWVSYVCAWVWCTCMCVRVCQLLCSPTHKCIQLHTYVQQARCCG